MDQRRSKRISQNLKVAFSCCNKLYAGTVTNFSENGMLIDSEIGNPINSRFEILFPIGKKILKIPAMHVRLVRNEMQHKGMGVELLEPSQKYLDFVHNIYENKEFGNIPSQLYKVPLSDETVMRKIRIIIIDDHITTLQSLGKWLSMEGYEVIKFSEPVLCPYTEKITDKCVKEYKCADIFLTDFEMPHVNGLELLQKQFQIGCKLDKNNKAVISGSVDEEVKSQIRKLGYSFFDKPIELPALSDWLNECKKRIDLSQPLSRVDG